MNREKSNPTASYTFPEPSDFSTLNEVTEMARREAAGARLRGRSAARDGASDGFHRGRDVLSWRPGLHPFTSSRSEHFQVLRVRDRATEKRGECSYVSAGIYKGRVDRADEVAASAHLVAGCGHAAAKHRLIDHEAEWFVLGRKDK